MGNCGVFVTSGTSPVSAIVTCLILYPAVGKRFLFVVVVVVVVRLKWKRCCVYLTNLR